MAPVQVRAATPADAVTLARLQLSIWQQAYAELLPVSVLFADPATHAIGWSDRAAAGGVLMAFEGAEAVGLAAVADQLELDRRAQSTGQIELLYVLPRWGRRGHGGRLLAHAADYLRGLGASRGEWWAPETDASVPRFLGGAGWAADGGRRVLDTGEGTFTEVRYSGGLDLILV